MTEDEPGHQQGDEAPSGAVTVTPEEFAEADVEAPIRDGNSVDCRNLGSLYETASKQHAQSGDEGAARVFGLLAQVTRMHFKPDDGTEPYGPMMVLADGTRSMIPSDLRGDQSAVFAAIAPGLQNPGLRARISDVAWLNDRKLYAMAQLAIDAYSDAVQAVLEARSEFFPNNPSASSRGGADMLCRACRIAKTTGWKDPEGTRLKALVSDVTQDAFDRKDHRGFLNAAEIALRFRIDEPTAVARNAETLAATGGPDAFTSRELWELAARAHQQSGDDAERDRCLVSAAERLVALAEGDGGRGIVAASHLMHAIEALRRIPNTDVRRRELEPRLREAQVSIRDQMGTISRPVDLTELHKDARESVEGLSLPHAFAVFARLAASRTPDELRDEAQRQAGENLFSSLIPMLMVDDEGKVISKSPAFVGDAETDDLALRHSIARNEGLLRQLVASGLIDPARRLIQLEHPLEQRDFIPLVAMSPFVPADREGLFSLAFTRFFGGDFISALHILVPQLENSLRYILKRAGHEPSSIRSDMTQENRTLSVMLKKDRDSLEGVFGTAIVYEIENLFDFPGGPALRHQLAHGLVSGAACYGTDAIYACWFMFRLCCLHVFEHWDRLAEWMEGNQGWERSSAAGPPSDVAEAADNDSGPS